MANITYLFLFFYVFCKSCGEITQAQSPPFVTDGKPFQRDYHVLDLLWFPFLLKPRYQWSVSCAGDRLDRGARVSARPLRHRASEIPTYDLSVSAIHSCQATQWRRGDIWNAPVGPCYYYPRKNVAVLCHICNYPSEQDQRLSARLRWDGLSGTHERDKLQWLLLIFTEIWYSVGTLWMRLEVKFALNLYQKWYYILMYFLQVWFFFFSSTLLFFSLCPYLSHLGWWYVFSLSPVFSFNDSVFNSIFLNFYFFVVIAVLFSFLIHSHCPCPIEARFPGPEKNCLT